MAVDLDQVLAELQRQTPELVRIRRAMEALALHLGAGRRGEAGSQSRSAAGAVATDAELDGDYGNPLVRFNPRGWSGTSHKGDKMSLCEPEFLDLLAVVLDQFADDEPDDKKQKYKRGDAAKARGWAARRRREAEQNGDDLDV